ncbi:hypothetical protein PLACP1_27860 [Planifilum fimeticola]
MIYFHDRVIRNRLTSPFGWGILGAKRKTQVVRCDTPGGVHRLHDGFPRKGGTLFLIGFRGAEGCASSSDPITVGFV